MFKFFYLNMLKFINKIPKWLLIILLLLLATIYIIGVNILIIYFRFYYKCFLIGFCLLLILDSIIELYLFHRFRSKTLKIHDFEEILPEYIKNRLRIYEEISNNTLSFIHFKEYNYKFILILSITVILLYIFM